MCNLYSITTNQAAIAALFRVVNRYVGNLAPMPGVFPDYPAPVVRNIGRRARDGHDALEHAAASHRPQEAWRWATLLTASLSVTADTGNDRDQPSKMESQQCLPM